MYPIAFVLIIVGQLIYYLGRRALAEARKPWLGANQESGVAGWFTAKQRIQHAVPATADPSGSDPERPQTVNNTSAV